MSYILKHFDTPLIKFNITSDAMEGLSASIVQAFDEHKALLPLDIELTNNGLLRWLKRRIIPKNRAFVQSFLAKLGLNANPVLASLFN